MKITGIWETSQREEAIYSTDSFLSPGRSTAVKQIGPWGEEQNRATEMANERWRDDLGEIGVVGRAGEIRDKLLLCEAIVAIE